MLRSTLVILSLAFSVSATAAEFDYNYFSIGYGTTDFDDINVDGDGFSVEGSYAINNDYHVFGNYESAGLDFGVDATTFSAGMGYNRSMTETVDLVARLSYEYVELDAPGLGDVDDSGTLDISGYAFHDQSIGKYKDPRLDDFGFGFKVKYEF